jgi:hypothetical protein
VKSLFCTMRRGCVPYIPPKQDILAALHAILRVSWRSADGVYLITPGVRHVMALQMDLVRTEHVSAAFLNLHS